MSVMFQKLAYFNFLRNHLEMVGKYYKYLLDMFFLKYLLPIKFIKSKNFIYL